MSLNTDSSASVTFLKARWSLGPALICFYNCCWKHLHKTESFFLQRAHVSVTGLKATATTTCKGFLLPNDQPPPELGNAVTAVDACATRNDCSAFPTCVAAPPRGLGASRAEEGDTDSVCSTGTACSESRGSATASPAPPVRARCWQQGPQGGGAQRPPGREFPLPTEPLPASANI